MTPPRSFAAVAVAWLLAVCPPVLALTVTRKLTVAS